MRPLLWAAAGALFLGGVVPSPGEGAEWLRGRVDFPPLLADPYAPRLSLAWAPDPDRIDVSLGTPIPLCSVGSDARALDAFLDAGVFFRLGEEKGFFPLETMDGLFGFGMEYGPGAWRGRLRLIHHSAHKADGDTSVTYRGFTYSRERAWLEGAFVLPNASICARLGAAWHAVPADPGLHAGLDAQWEPVQDGRRPFVALHLEADEARAWRLQQSLVLGWSWGDETRARLGLRYYRGDRPHGQYWQTPETVIGLELQFSGVVVK